METILSANNDRDFKNKWLKRNELVPTISDVAYTHTSSSSSSSFGIEIAETERAKMDKRISKTIYKMKRASTSVTAVDHEFHTNESRVCDYAATFFYAFSLTSIYSVFENIGCCRRCWHLYRFHVFSLHTPTLSLSLCVCFFLRIIFRVSFAV